MQHVQRQVRLSGLIGGSSNGSRDGANGSGGNANGGRSQVAMSMSSTYGHRPFSFTSEHEPVERLPAAFGDDGDGDGSEAVTAAAAAAAAAARAATLSVNLSVQPNMSVFQSVAVHPHFLNRQVATVLLLECTTGDGTFMFRIDSIGTAAGTSVSDNGSGSGDGAGEQQERDLLFLSLLYQGVVYHHPIVTRSDQLYLGTRPFDSLEAMVAYHSQKRENGNDLTLQCALGAQHLPEAQRQPGSSSMGVGAGSSGGGPGMVRRPTIDASRDMLDCDNLLDELEDIVNQQNARRRHEIAFSPEVFVPESNA